MNTTLLWGALAYDQLNEKEEDVNDEKES